MHDILCMNHFIEHLIFVEFSASQPVNFSVPCFFCLINQASLPETYIFLQLEKTSSLKRPIAFYISLSSLQYATIHRHIHTPLPVKDTVRIHLQTYTPQPFKDIVKKNKNAVHDSTIHTSTQADRQTTQQTRLHTKHNNVGAG